jgi:hypothetical protein
MKLPRVQAVDLSGYNGGQAQPILIEVVDELPATSVRVEIFELNDSLLEAGPAALK